MPSPSSGFTPFRSTRMASRVRSDTLRAPVTEQSRLRAEYSSSESRTLIMRDLGFRTVMSDWDTGQRFWPRLLLAETERMTTGRDDIASVDFQELKIRG